MQSIHEIVKIQAGKSADEIAFLAPDRRPLTYGRLATLVDEVASTLAAHGISQTDRVAVLLPNGPDMAAAFIAVAACATCAPLDPGSTPAEIEFSFSDLGITALLVQSDLESAASGIAKRMGITVFECTPLETAGDIALSRRSSDVDLRPNWADENDLAIVIHTSGTTDSPKIVPLTHRNVCTSARNHVAVLDLVRKDRCLNVMPLFHIHGLVSVIISSLYAGASIVCTPGFDGDAFLDWIEEFKPTWYTASPTIHMAVLKCATRNPDRLGTNSFRLIRSAAAPLPSTVLVNLENTFGVAVIEAYGMTEAAGQICSNPLPPGKRRQKSVGKAAGPEVAVVDTGGQFVSPGTQGELVIRGENVMTGYENIDPTDFEINGWLRTGDLGLLHEDGYCFIQGRLKELINRGGHKIAPHEVDEVLMAHPAVAEATAFPVPHPTLGNDVAAAVVLHELTTVSPDEIRQFAFSILADYKVPSRVICVDSIPKNSIGKPVPSKLTVYFKDLLRPDSDPPTDSFEIRLAEIWQEVLNIDDVCVHDNFFMRGGDSLQAVRLLSSVRDVFEVELPVRSIFAKPSLGEQAALIKESPSVKQ